MRYDWRAALDRQCPWCSAAPQQGCLVLNGNYLPRRSPETVHVLRALVWEHTDTARPCPACGADAGFPCRTIRPRQGTYRPVYRPHGSRLIGRSRLAVTARERVHVRDPRNAARALCGVRVLLEPVADGRAHCAACRHLDAHLHVLAERAAHTG